MSGNLLSRLGKLEVSAAARLQRPGRVVRIVTNDGEETEAMQQAAEMGLDTSPDSKDILIVRLICGKRKGIEGRPFLSLVEQERIL